MFIKILKFLGLIFLLHILTAAIPFGNMIAAAIVIYALWKIVD